MVCAVKHVYSRPWHGHERQHLCQLFITLRALPGTTRAWFQVEHLTQIQSLMANAQDLLHLDKSLLIDYASSIILYRTFDIKS
jgi:hypothetical protein